MQIESETIIEIANTLGIAVERIFEIFVSAQVTTGIISAILLSMVTIGTILAYKYICKMTDDDDNNESRLMGTAITMIIFIIISLFIYDILICIFLPEYAAARELI